MKQWTSEIEIDAPIEKVWKFIRWIFGKYAKDYAASS